MVAHERANCIVTLRNAKAKHIKELIDKVQGGVFGQFGVKLKRETIYVPEDIW